MLKILQNNRNGKRPSEGDEPGSNAEGGKPPSKLMRILGDLKAGPKLSAETKANWNTLPRELQGKIFRDLIDPYDIKSTLKNLTAFKLTCKSFEAIANRELFDKDFIKLTSAIINEYSEILDAFDLEEKRYNRGSSRLNSMTLEADFLPIRTAAERSVVVNYILNYKDPEASKEAMRNLVRNIDYLNSKEKVRVVNYVCKLDEEVADDLVIELIKKAEYLEPKECASLAKKSCLIQSYSGDDWQGLEFWASKIDLLNKDDQADILSHGLDAGKSFFPRFAKHIDKVAKVNRSSLVNDIVELPFSHPGKFEALSHLAKRLNYLEIRDRRKVISSILNGLGQSSELSADAQPWYSKSRFCEIEAVHHLQTHKELMSGSEQFTVSNLIKETISEIAPESYGAKSQLITHMSDEERSTFVETALEHSDVNIKKGVVCGLTARMEDLFEDEVSEYINHVSRRYDDSDLLVDIFTYNIGNNIEVFEENQRSVLVKRLGRLIYESGEPRYADSFELISENASFLNNTDVLYTIKASRRVVNDYIDSDRPMGDGANASSIRSCAGYAARCAANWAREAAAKAMVYEEDAVVRDNRLDRPVDAHQDGKTDSTGNYDRRSRESTFER